jgi:hypothetical protein
MRLQTEPKASQYAGQLNVVKLCHDYALLNVHDQVGLRLSRSERRILKGLRRLLEGDASRHRRCHRRLPLMMPLALRTTDDSYGATAINISGGGMFLMTAGDLPVGTTVELELGAPTKERYRFNGVVRWRRQHGDLRGLGIRFSAVPVERTLARKAS